VQESSAGTAKKKREIGLGEKPVQRGLRAWVDRKQERPHDVIGS
jgi:hypothetical protein